MNTKLTLHLNKPLLQKAKTYAKEHNVSWFLLIETYLQKIIADNNTAPAPKGSIVNELSGVITLGNDEDFREDCMHYLKAK